MLARLMMHAGRQASMEDRALQCHHSHWAFVTQAIAVVINNGTLYGSKYNQGHPYRTITNLRDDEQQTCPPRRVCIDGTIYMYHRVLLE